MEVEEVDPEYKDAAGSEDIGSSDAAIPAPVEKGPARPQKQVAQEAPSVHVLKAAVQLGVNYFILPELFHVALHSATVFHDEFWEVLIKKIYDILLLADCKFKSSDYTMQIKVLEAMANAYVEDNDGLCVQTLLWERYIEATKDRAADPNPVNEGRCLQLSVLMTIFEWHLPLTRKASLRWHLVAHCKDAEERAEHVEFVINELIPALAHKRQAPREAAKSVRKRTRWQPSARVVTSERNSVKAIYIGSGTPGNRIPAIAGACVIGPVNVPDADHVFPRNYNEFMYAIHQEEEYIERRKYRVFMVETIMCPMDTEFYGNYHLNTRKTMHEELIGKLEKIAHDFQIVVVYMNQLDTGEVKLIKIDGGSPKAGLISSPVISEA